jgi:hypothetical protein
MPGSTLETVLAGAKLYRRAQNCRAWVSGPRARKPGVISKECLVAPRKCRKRRVGCLRGDR